MIISGRVLRLHRPEKDMKPNWRRYLITITFGLPFLTFADESAYTAIDFPDASATQAWGINPRGDIVGFYTLPDKSSHGFLLNGARYTTIDFPGSAVTLLNGINPRGDIVGEYGATLTSVHHGFLMTSEGSFRAIEPPDALSSTAIGITPGGDILGAYTSMDNVNHAFLLSGGNYSLIDYPGASATVVNGIGARGEVVGSCVLGGVSHGFVLSGGNFTLFDPPVSAFTTAMGINPRGDIVGRYRDAAGINHGFILSAGQFTSIDFPGASYTGATAINTTDDVLGRYQIAGVFHGFILSRRVRHNAHYTVTDLGTLGGSASIAFGINNAGEVAGGANVVGENQHPFLWRAGGMSDLGTLGGPNGNAAGPNGNDGVAPLVETSNKDPLNEDFCGFDTNLICLGANLQAGALTPLFTLGGNNAQALALNSRGQLVGVAETAIQDPTCPSPQVLQFEAVLWGPKAGEIQMLGPLPGDTVGFALGLNDRGQVVGSSGSCADTHVSGFEIGPHAVLWDHGSPVHLGTLGGKTAAAGAAVNNRDEVAGAAKLADEITSHSFIWTKEAGLVDTGTVGADLATYPTAINDAGQIVGISCDTDITGNCRAYVGQYLGDATPTLTDLNTLLPPDSPYYLVLALGINDAGEIVGMAVDQNTGDAHAFLATPLNTSSGDAKLSHVSERRWAIPQKVRRLIRGQLGQFATRVPWNAK
jgi:probable HAF family extracellular repeat protein